MAQWAYIGGGLTGVAPGTPVQSGGGGIGTGAALFRNGLDAQRSARGPKIPDAEWPDGYLGTIQSRREDRLLDSLKTRINQRNYQRGVHKGEKIDNADYMWPSEWHPMLGLQYEAQGLGKPGPLMTVFEQLQMDGDMLPVQARDAVHGIVTVPAGRRNEMGVLAPTWR